MKNIRRIFFFMFMLAMLVSAIMMFYLIRGNTPTVLYMAGFAFIAVQLAALNAVLVKKERVIKGILSIFTGVASMFSGFLTFASTPAPASEILRNLAFFSVALSFVLLIGFIIIGILFFR